MVPIQKILVPVDFSLGSDAALGAALALSRHLGASVTLLHVIEPPSFMEIDPSDTDSLTATETIRAHEELAEGRAELEMRRLLYSVSSRDLPRVKMLVREGEPSKAIVDVAQEEGNDLIVMGTHGRTGIAHLLLGSVAERVLRAATCPVLTVRLPGKEQRAA